MTFPPTHSPTRKLGYCNIYAKPQVGGEVGYVYPTRKAADDAAHPARIACAVVSYDDSTGLPVAGQKRDVE